MITHTETKARELLQVSKIMGVEESPKKEGDCKIFYYHPIENCRVEIYPLEDFEQIAEQLGIKFEG
jgi:hypothetical protein